MPLHLLPLTKTTVSNALTSLCKEISYFREKSLSESKINTSIANESGISLNTSTWQFDKQCLDATPVLEEKFKSFRLTLEQKKLIQKSKIFSDISAKSISRTKNADKKTTHIKFTLKEQIEKKPVLLKDSKK